MYGIGMQEILVLLVLIVPVVIAVLLTRRAKKHDPNPVGIAGWLGLLGFTLLILLWTYSKDALETLGGIDWKALGHDQITYTVLVFALVIALEIGIVAWSVYVAVLFVRKRRRFRWAWIVLTLSVLMTSVAGVAFGNESAWEFIRGFVGSIAWLLYVLRSKRVANTFVN